MNLPHTYLATARLYIQSAPCPPMQMGELTVLWVRFKNAECFLSRVIRVGTFAAANVHTVLAAGGVFGSMLSVSARIVPSASVPRYHN